MKPLTGKRVLITGASSGIGCAAADAFGRQGCRLALLARGREGLETVAARAPADGGGALVATGSVMARVPLPTFCSYAAAKHALRGFLNSLRIELKSARVPITVSMVHPGAVNTPLWDHLT